MNNPIAQAEVNSPRPPVAAAPRPFGAGHNPSGAQGGGAGSAAHAPVRAGIARLGLDNGTKFLSRRVAPASSDQPSTIEGSVDRDE